MVRSTLLHFFCLVVPKGKILGFNISCDISISSQKSSKLSIVTSGTATLETALLNTPQIVCYKSSNLNILLAKFFVKVKFISLVNLVCNKEVIKELIQNDVNELNLKNEINSIINGKSEKIKQDYLILNRLIGSHGVTKKVASHIFKN